MKLGRQAIFVMWPFLAGAMGLPQLWGRTTCCSANYLPAPNAAHSSPSSGRQPHPQSGDPQQKAYAGYLEAEKRAEGQVFAAIPGRSRSWRVQLEYTRRHLDVFGRDLAVLRIRQADFEASLTPEQESRFDLELQRLHGLSQDIQRDFESLQDELRKGYPTRWHVDDDTWRMYRELDRWKKLDQGIAKAIGIGSYGGGK